LTARVRAGAVITALAALTALTALTAFAVIWSAWPGAAPMTLASYTDAVASTGTVGADTLAPPTGLAAIGGTSVSLTWTPTVDTYATGYSLLRGSVNGGPYGAVATVTPGSASATTDAPGAGTWYYVLQSAYQSWVSANSGQAAATVTSTVTTTYATCTTTAADTSGAGDNNGYQSNPTRACANDSSFATDSNSGTSTSTSCGTGATPSTTKDRHRFWGFATGLPVTVTSIDGIEVQVDLGMGSSTGTTNICAQLSWNGGTTWTTIKPLAISATAETTYTFGGVADTWGRTWLLGQFSTSNLRLRLIDASSSSTKRFDLDYVALRVTYMP